MKFLNAGSTSESARCAGNSLSVSSADIRRLKLSFGVETPNDIPALCANRTTGVDVERTQRIAIANALNG
jgi:hypothetical protein